MKLREKDSNDIKNILILKGRGRKARGKVPKGGYTAMMLSFYIGVKEPILLSI